MNKLPKVNKDTRYTVRTAISYDDLFNALNHMPNEDLISLILDIDADMADWHFTIGLISQLLRSCDSKDVVEGINTINQIFKEHELNIMLGE